MLFFYLTSGLFLGWSLGANDAANVFGTAVSTRMLRYKTATVICAIFVIIGAVAGGSGTTHTLNTLGKVDAPAGAFITALCAAMTVFLMIRLRLPASTSQAIIGAIIGWNIFSGGNTDYATVKDILASWVICPVLAALIAILIYYIYRYVISFLKLHLLVRDFYTRAGLLLTGILGSYCLGANNVANVAAVYTGTSLFHNIKILGLFSITGTQQLFIIGGLSIAAGVLTYSKRIMKTVGGSIYRLSPEMALVVMLAQTVVLYLFSSQSIEHLLLTNHLPSVPLVPVSSTQAVIGAIIGIGLIKSIHEIKFKILGDISLGWLIVPLIAGISTFLMLYLFKSVFIHFS